LPDLRHVRIDRPTQEGLAIGQGTRGNGPRDKRQRIHAGREQERDSSGDADLAGLSGLQRARPAEILCADDGAGPAYKQDDEVAYTWATKGRVAKCSIYLESAEAGAKSGTGAIVGCEAKRGQQRSSASAGDPKLTVSSSQDPKHLNDVMELFKKQSERARSGLPK
jgi:hypothetical protein